MVCLVTCWTVYYPSQNNVKNHLICKVYSTVSDKFAYGCHTEVCGKRSVGSTALSCHHLWQETLPGTHLLFDRLSELLLPTFTSAFQVLACSLSIAFNMTHNDCKEMKKCGQWLIFFST